VRLFALAAAISIAAAARPVTWGDLPPAVQARLEQAGFTASSFPTQTSAIDRSARTRVRDGDFDHLVFYVLQSTHFTRRSPIEPALSAKAHAAAGGIPPDVGARIAAFVGAVESGDRDPRVAYFRTLLADTPPRDRRAVIGREYERAMRFLFDKEFASRGASTTEQLYQTRGFSTDTEVEAGYAVQSGLGVLKGLSPALRIRRVLIVGPGMDLAPRTGMLEAGPPESYQPWAVIDALVGLGLSRLDDLEVVGADINPRVVDHLRASMREPPRLRLVSGLGESDAVALTPGFREYFQGLGGSIGSVAVDRGAPGHLAKAVTVSAKAAAVLRAERLNVVTERLDERFDLVIATNILPYFGGADLMLALSNISSMVAPDGVFLHNDTRPEVQEDAALADLVAEQLRQVIIASVKGAPPLADTIVLHRRR